MHAGNTNVVIGRSWRVACQSQFFNSAGPMSPESRRWHDTQEELSVSGTGLYCRKVTVTKITRMLWSVRSVHKTHKTVIQHLWSDIDIQWNSRLRKSLRIWFSQETEEERVTTLRRKRLWWLCLCLVPCWLSQFTACSADTLNMWRAGLYLILAVLLLLLLKMILRLSTLIWRFNLKYILIDLSTCKGPMINKSSW